MKKSLNTLQFIERSKKIHGDKFDYSKVKYTESKNKVEIICSIHGAFKQFPQSHLKGGGCNKCRGLNRQLSMDDFLTRSISIHGDKYDYSSVKYNGCDTKVKILCPNHGEFEQTPYNHYNGAGCNQCAIESHHQNQSYTNDEFIQVAKKIHGDKYDYSLVNYKKSHDKVKIICTEHGVFEQTANSHINGCGCPTCKLYKGERYISLYLKEKNINFISQYSDKRCKDKKELKFDFSIKINDKIIMIEYNGLQHYKSIEWFGGDKALENSKKRDNIKKVFCENNNIDLIIIDYKIIKKEKIFEVLNKKFLPLYMKYKK